MAKKKGTKAPKAKRFHRSLAQFLVDLAIDPDARSKYAGDRDAVIDAAKLRKETKEALKKADRKDLVRRLEDNQENSGGKIAAARKTSSKKR